MPSTLPCPNPSCTHVFTPQDVRGATSLTCPECGTVFQFRAGARPTPPSRKAAPAAPPAPPRSVPVARPVAAEPEPVISAPDRVRRGSQRISRGRGADRRWVIVSFVICLLLLVAAGGAGWTFRDRLLGSNTPADDGPAIESLPMNYRFRLPPAPWVEDRGIVRELGASFAMRRGDPNAWFVVVVKDYKDRNPRDDEMMHEAVTRLQKLFKKGMESEQRDDDSFGGLPAQRFVFTAENRNNVAVSGECVMTAYNGIGYSFFGWTPSAANLSVLADVQQQWRDARQRFVLLKEREGWIGKRPEVVEAEGRKAPYRLNYTKGLWENDDHPDGGDLLLRGRDPDSPQDAHKWAWVRVCILPAAADLESAMTAARTFVEEREKKLYPDVKLDAVPEAAKGGLADGALELGKVKAQVGRLRVQKAEDYEYFYAVAAVPRPAQTLVIICECAWPHRDLWEQRFGPVLHSLHFDEK